MTDYWFFNKFHLMEKMSGKGKTVITCSRNEELQSVIESTAETKYLFIFFLILLNYQQTTLTYVVNDRVLGI